MKSYVIVIGSELNCDDVARTLEEDKGYGVDWVDKLSCDDSVSVLARLSEWGITYSDSDSGRKLCLDRKEFWNHYKARLLDDLKSGIERHYFKFLNDSSMDNMPCFGTYYCGELYIWTLPMFMNRYDEDGLIWLEMAGVAVYHC